MITVNSIVNVSIPPRSFWVALFVLGGSAGSQAQSFDLETHIGLYQVVGAKCDIAKGEFDPCENTHFIEIVKGQFIEIKDTDLAYIFWSGDATIDSALQYEAHLIKTNPSTKVEGGKLFLSADKDVQEYFTFSDDRLTEYSASYVVGKEKQVRVIQYTLKKVERDNVPFVRLNYPGNK